MDLSFLTSIGLSEKAATIYLATLHSGLSSVQKIAQKTNIKRPTVYLHIQDLLRNGYLQKVPLGKKEYYAASDPQMLKDQLLKNIQNFDSVLPDLKKIYSEFQGKLKIRILVGEKALDAVYDEISKANQISFIADLISFEKSFQGAFNKISRAICDNEIRTREIIPNTEAAKMSSKRYATNAGKFYSSRIAVNGPIHNDCAIYGQTLAFFRINEFNLFVILIEEATIVETMKTIFDLAWASATPYIGR